MAAKKKAVAKPKKGGGRRAAKETKDEQVDISAGVQLLLGNMPPSKDVMYHYQTILGLMEKASSAQGRVGDAKKKAKESGIDVSALMTAMKFTRLEPLDLATLLKQQAMLMVELGLPVQMSLYETKYGSIEKQATALGWEAGRAGRSPPVDMFPEGTPGHPELMRAWQDGQAQIILDGKNKKPDPDFD